MALNRLALIVLLSMKNWNGISALQTSLLGECHDMHGQVMEQGRHYVPGPDICKLCICDNGQPKGCKAVLCSPPQACKSFQIGNSCSSGVTATLSLSLLFFIVNRFRQRKIRVSANRQNSDEPRNIASIGYIGGNLNYLSSGNMNMEYPYDGNSNQYQLWKPSNGYFPRGEAPPPYEEAVAQANENVSAQCTVSVATTTHSAPEGTYEIQPNITTSTTNLININISNAGNITAVASGENHQINKCYSTINARQLRLQPASQSQHTQYASLPLPTSSNYLEAQRSALNDCAMEQQPAMIESNMNGIATIATVNMTEAGTAATAMACNYKNCTISGSLNCNRSVRRSDIVFQTPQHTRIKRDPDHSGAGAVVASSRNQFGRPSHRADINIGRSNADIDKDASNAILPPPLFDETLISSNTLPLLPNDSIRQIKSRRHHRTIPRHFTISASPGVSADPPTANNVPLAKGSKLNDDHNKVPPVVCASASAPSAPSASSSSSAASAAPVASNKKLICQCPVQHVPMTYMGSNHLNLTRNQSNDLLLTTLAKNVAKSASFTSSPTTSTVAQCYQRNSASGLLSAAPSTSRPQSMSSGQSNSLQLPKTPVKIPTISKQIGNNEFDTIMPAMATQMAADAKDIPSSGSNVALSKIELMPEEIKSTPIISNSEMFASSPFPIQFIESMGKTKEIANSERNPVLPPKMYKMNGNCHHNQHQQQPQQLPQQTSSRIHTISKPIGVINFPPSAQIPLDQPMKRREHHRERSKSPSRDKALTLSAAPAVDARVHSNQSSKMTNYPTTNFAMLPNANHYTLPKSTTAKMSLSSTINDVVNKVPSIVNIPTSYQRTSKPNRGHSPAEPKPMVPSSSAYANLDYRSMTSHTKTNGTTAAANQSKAEEKPLPVCTTYTNCSNPKEHFLPNDTSLDDDYLSECENCKSAHGSRYYLDEENDDQPQETMTLQRKMDEKEDEQTYYRTSSTLPTNTKQKTTVIKNREPWFSTIPGSSSSEEDVVE